MLSISSVSGSEDLTGRLTSTLTAPFSYLKMYQSLVSTTPLSLTVSTQNQPVVVKLDGRLDWVVQTPKVLAYAGPTLAISPSSLVSLGRARSTGTVTGRGLLALAGSGDVYSVDLQQNESFLVRSDTVLGHLAQKGASVETVPKVFEDPTEESQRAVVEKEERNRREGLSLVRKAAAKLADWTTEAWSSVWNRATGSSGFVRIHGPTTVLIEADGVPNNTKKLKFDRSSIPNLTSITGSEQNSNTQTLVGKRDNPKDYLKVATVENGKVKFESVDNFKSL